MTKVLFITPWIYHDEGRSDYDSTTAWRNGPYNIIQLATILKLDGHEVLICDLQRILIGHRGNLDAALDRLRQDISSFKPDIIGTTFFSIHHREVKIISKVVRSECKKIGLDAIYIGGGIHPTIEPNDTLYNLDFDYAFAGEADIAIRHMANGQKMSTISGVHEKGALSSGNCSVSKGEQIKDLNDLPFPDWSLCDYKFYAAPTYARHKMTLTSGLDLSSSRGCVYKCSFCAYNALSSVRFYTAEYLVNQMEQMHKDYGVTAPYFTDSTIGNNRRVLIEMCELILERGLQNKIQWLANIRPNQVNEELLLLMKRAGCQYLFYGFESNSPRMLERMNKGCTVEHNEKAAELHRKLGIVYNASMIIGLPEEREEDINASLDFISRHKPPSVGINPYVPLPGSPDYDALKANGKIIMDDPEEWRMIGEVNTKKIYCDMSREKFDQLLLKAQTIAYSEIPAMNEKEGFWSQHANQIYISESPEKISLNRFYYD